MSATIYMCVFLQPQQPRLRGQEQLHLHRLESQIFTDQLCFHGTLTHLHGEEVALVGRRTIHLSRAFSNLELGVNSLNL